MPAEESWERYVNGEVKNHLVFVRVAWEKVIAVEYLYRFTDDNVHVEPH